MVAWSNRPFRKASVIIINLHFSPQECVWDLLTAAFTSISCSVLSFHSIRSGEKQLHLLLGSNTTKAIMFYCLPLTRYSPISASPSAALTAFMSLS